MIRLPLIAAAAIACSIGTTAAVAQERHGWRDGGRHAHRDYRPHQRGHHHAPAPRYWVSPVRPYRYYAPYWAYTGPVLAYPYYEPAPVIVERVYEAPRFYEPAPAQRFEERSYAQIAPEERRERPAAPPPAPRLERYTLSARELFEFDQATLRSPQPKLDEIAQAMKRHPEIDRVTITGHTDRLGSEAYNMKLSQRRAEAVKAYLVARGVEARRLTAVGKGEAHPVVQCPDTARAELIRCLEPNRRVEVEQITIEQRGR